MKTIHYGCINSPLGTLWAAVSEKGLWALGYGTSEQEFLIFARQRGPVVLSRDDHKTAPALNEALAYLNGAKSVFAIPIDWTGMTDAQREVRQAVMAIPYGETRSYGEIARQVGRPNAARAVGRINATNPVLFAIPCHRVIGADGKLTGYGGKGGIQTKAELLAMEGEGKGLR